MLGVVETGLNWPKLMAGDCGEMLHRGSRDPELHTNPDTKKRLIVLYTY
jgi:hypothetical protein